MSKVIIGKYTLESLTTGMYKDPYVLYREYIQNAADSIDKAINDKIIDEKDSKIEVKIFKDGRVVEISDNGVGISKDKVYKVLMDIGNSRKKSANNKGFRGIGRLSGLGYCEKIIFETTVVGENVKSIVTFDGVKLQELLSPGKYENLTLEDVIMKSSDMDLEPEESETHFFKVKLINVNEKLKLLEFNNVLEYLQETAPVPYNGESFKFGEVINNTLEELKINRDEYRIFVSDEGIQTQVYKPYRSKLIVDLKKKILDEISGIDIEVITNDLKDNKVVAVVWYGKNNLLGTITEDKLKGLRIRKSGLLIGDRFSANSIFKEDRFNGWVIGEIIVVDKDIIPNARRDDFEKNDDYLFLMKKLRIIGEKISSEIRAASKRRNDIQKNNTSDLTNKKQNSSGGSSNKSILKKIDLLVSEVKIKNDLIDKLERVLRSYKIPHNDIESIIEDMLD